MNLRYAIMQYNVYLYQERGLKEESVRNIERHLDLFMNWFYEEKVGFKVITKDVLLEFRQYLCMRLKPSTVNMRMKILNQLIGFMNENGFNQGKAIPIKELMLPVAVGEDIRIASIDEIHKLERAIRIEGNHRDLLMLKLIYEYGLSRSEILGLRISDFFREREEYNSEVRYQISVTFKKKVRTLDVSKEIGMMIERQLTNVPKGNPYIFFGTKEGPLVQDIINQNLEKYSVIGGLNRIINPQAIKAAYIRDLFEKGYSVKEVSEITGMSKHNFYSVYKKIVNPLTRWAIDSPEDGLKEDMEDEFAKLNRERMEELNQIINEEIE